jgi:hypothetical protein
MKYALILLIVFITSCVDEDVKPQAKRPYRGGMAKVK